MSAYSAGVVVRKDVFKKEPRASANAVEVIDGSRCAKHERVGNIELWVPRLVMEEYDRQASVGW